MRSWSILTAGLVIAAACGQGGESGPDGGPDAAPTAQGSPARGDLVINEVAPRPTSGPDWIELHNRSSAALDLCDFFVTDSLDRLDHYVSLGGVPPPDPCEPVLLDPGGYLVVYADDDAAAGPDHAPFKLGEADEVHVVTRDGLPGDSLVYLYRVAVAGDSLARTPDGEGLFHPAEPTPGAANPEVLP